MSDEFEIKVTGVDKDNIREHNALPGTWIIPFKLSAKPDESWVRNFNDVFKKTINAGEKKRAKIVEDCVEVNVSDADDQQNVLDTLKHIIAETNIACREIFQHKMKMQDDLKALQKSNADTLQKMKENTGKLKF